MSNLSKVSYSLNFPDICHPGVRVPQTAQFFFPEHFQNYPYINDPFPDEEEASIAVIPEEAFPVIPEDDPHGLHEVHQGADWPEWQQAIHPESFQSDVTLLPQPQSHMGQLVRLCRVIYRNS